MSTKATKVSAHDFCVAWMESETVAEVAEKTGLKPGTVSQRASSLRGKGVPLKFFAKKSPRNDYNALAALVKDMESDTDTEARETREAKKAAKKSTPAPVLHAVVEEASIDDEDYDGDWGDDEE